jgi:hypothetical protein
MLAMILTATVMRTMSEREVEVEAVAEVLA